ncbi:MAG: FHA domain-containing protein [Thermoanaerobaculia bacterium]|nr:FHA domain-containing protein [Thermoanaerobaculia bacterium]
MLLGEGPNVIGREPPAGIWICHPSVSREHARIVVTEERAAIEDLGSKNGTWRGETAVKGLLPLADGDEIRVGAVHLVYRGPGAACPGATATYE